MFRRFVNSSDESGMRPRGWQVGIVALLTRRSLSARSSSVCHFVTLIAFVFYGMTLHRSLDVFALCGLSKCLCFMKTNLCQLCVCCVLLLALRKFLEAQQAVYIANEFRSSWRFDCCHSITNIETLYSWRADEDHFLSIVTPCHYVCCSWRFECLSCLHLQGQAV